VKKDIGLFGDKRTNVYRGKIKKRGGGPELGPRARN